MPQTKTFSGVIENAFGKPLPSPIKYEGSFEELQYDESKAKAVVLTLPALDGADEIPAKEVPTLADIYSLVNNASKANARQKAMQKALTEAGIEKPEVGKDMEFTFKQMLGILKATFKDKDEATLRQMANANLGTNY